VEHAYHGKPLADSGTSHRDATSPAQVGRVYPNHPAALRPGMRMGSDSPEQHEYNVFVMTIMPCSKTARDTPEGGS
jgi:hypothetical protein